MAQIITSVKIEFSKKHNAYVVTTTHKNGPWEGGSTGAKIYPVDQYLVYTGWGNGIPLKVFKSEDEMIHYFTGLYTCSAAAA